MESRTDQTVGKPTSQDSQANMGSRRSRRFLVWAAACVALVAAFYAGRRVEHYLNGHSYQVHDAQSYNAGAGSIHLRHVTDTQGPPFLDTGSSVISLQNEEGTEVTLYQSRRVFQESWPWVAHLQINGDHLQWQDGMYQYSLQIQRMEPVTQPK